MKTLVIIPTYNERDNIVQLIPALLKQEPEIEILVVDDTSPDGTAQAVEELQKNHSQLHLLIRSKKEGLAKAYLAGFKWGLEKDFEVLVEMDADFSHRPEDLEPLLDALRTHDFAMGSRWVSGGGVQDWGWMRHVISSGGSWYTRRILGYQVKDWTGGFNAWKREVLEAIGLGSIQSTGYAFQIELKYRALVHGFRGIEVPIFFENRKAGVSKMSGRIIVEALYRVAKLKASVSP